MTDQTATVPKDIKDQEMVQQQVEESKLQDAAAEALEVEGEEKSKTPTGDDEKLKTEEGTTLPVDNSTEQNNEQIETPEAQNKEELEPEPAETTISKSVEPVDKLTESTDPVKVAAEPEPDTEIHELIQKQEYWNLRLNKNVVVIIGVILLALTIQLALKFLL